MIELDAIHVYGAQYGAVAFLYNDNKDHSFIHSGAQYKSYRRRRQAGATGGEPGRGRSQGPQQVESPGGEEPGTTAGGEPERGRGQGPQQVESQRVGVAKPGETRKGAGTPRNTHRYSKPTSEFQETRIETMEKRKAH